MKNLFTFLIAIFAATFAVNAQTTIFADDFQSSGFPTGYTMYDQDGNTVNSQIASVFPNAWNRLQFTNDPGQFFIASTSDYTPAGTADDWVVTPQLTLTTNNYLFFKTRSGSSTSPDGYEVKISTTTNAVSSFTTNLLTVASESASWTSHAIDLSAYSNQTVYIAWRNNTFDGYVLALDEIEVVQLTNGDAKIDEITVADKVVENSTVNVTGSVKNVGADTLTSVDVNWRVNGGTVNSQTITGLNLKYGETATFSHNVTLTPSNAGSFSNLEVWTSNPNSNPDSNTSNDTLSKNLFVVLGNSTQRDVLFEEFTTAECVFCPDGHVRMAQILALIPNVIPVSIHSCFYEDAMTIQEARDLCSTIGSGSAPSGMVDRILHEGDDEPAHGRALWQSRVDARSQDSTSAAIGFNGAYNDTTRAVSLNVDINFLDYELPGDIRLSLMIIEDSLSGPSGGTPGVNRWNQRNAYNNTVGHPMYQKGDPIVGYIHRHVLRDILPSTWGDNTVIPSSVTPNSTYSHTFNFTLNSNYKEDDVSFVAVVSYKGTSLDGYEVINAKEIVLGDFPTSIVKNIKEIQNFDIYPNPAANLTNVDLTLTENEQIEVTVFDITGKVMYNKNHGKMVKGTHRLPIDVSAFANGFYFVNIKVGEGHVSRKFTVNR